MGKLLRKKLYISLLYILTAALVEIISFAVMGMGVFPTYWGIDVAFILAFGVLIFVVPSCRASVAIGGVLLLAQCVLAFINEALQRMSGMVFSFNMLNLAKEVGGVFSSDFVNWWLCAGFVLIYGIFLAVSILLDKRLITPRQRFTRDTVIILLLCCLIGENASLILYHSTISTFQSAVASDELADYNDDNYLYATQFIPSKALKKFGSFGFYFINATNLLNNLLDNPGVSSGGGEYAALDSYFAKGSMSADVYGDADRYTGALSGKNIVLVVIESGEWYGINEEYTPTLYSMAKNSVIFSEYYARDKTNHSEAMSVLGSYPVATEPSGMQSEAVTFTLPNLLGDAGYTTNYFHANTASFYNRDATYGADGVYGFDTAHFLNDMPALDGCGENGKIVKKDFYNFDKDAAIAKNYFSEYTFRNPEDRAFFTMQMTLSSHGHYDDLVNFGDYPFRDSENAEELKEKFSKSVDVKGFEKYYEIIDGYPKTYVLPEKGIRLNEEESDLTASRLETVYLRYKRFQAGMMDLDEEINELVCRLEQTGELDDTAFLFYADHTAYYNSQNYYLKGIPEEESWNTALYNIPCFLWYGGSMNCSVSAENFYEGYHEIDFTATKDADSLLQSGTADKFVCSFDILPTLLQLVGYEYNLNLYQGVSMFSDLTSVFVSRESGIFTDRFYYDGITVSARDENGEWVQYDYESTRDSEEGFPDEINAFLKKSILYYDKQEMLEEMYRTGYFSHRSLHDGTVKDGEKILYVSQYRTVGEA